MTVTAVPDSLWEQRFRALVDTLSKGIVIHRSLVPLFANSAFAEMHGFQSVEEFMDVGTLLGVTPPDAWQERMAQGALAEPGGGRRRIRHMRQDGAVLWVDVVENVVVWDDGPALQATIEDVTFQVLASERSELQTMMLNDALQTMGEGILMTDVDGTVVLNNGRFLALFGIEDEDLPSVPIIRDVLELMAERGHFGDPLDAGTVITEMLGLFEEHEPFQLERPIGGDRVVRFYGTPRGSGGTVLMVSDVTEQKTLEQELRRLATTDPLTGLFNRRQFTLLGQRALDEHRHSAKPLAVLALDIDHFKIINDTYGHAAGDEALKMVARILHDALRGADVIGRLGGEEFGVVLADTMAPAAFSTADRLRRALEQSVVESDGQSIKLTTSVGLTMLRSEDRHLESLMKRADAALYDAKKSGRNRVIAAENDLAA
jgi:diguanylate cyclase (GGDEF)-like protein/PAS domain S-box-containing protein